MFYNALHIEYAIHFYPYLTKWTEKNSNNLTKQKIKIINLDVFYHELHRKKK